MSRGLWAPHEMDGRCVGSPRPPEQWPVFLCWVECEASPESVHVLPLGAWQLLAGTTQDGSDICLLEPLVVSGSFPPGDTGSVSSVATVVTSGGAPGTWMDRPSIPFCDVTSASLAPSGLEFKCLSW